MDDDAGIIADPLAVALTRPSTKWGVTYAALIFNLVVSVEAVVFVHLAWGLICVPIHAICYLICLYDPRSFELLQLWARSKFNNQIKTWYFWPVSSYGPLDVPAPAGWWRRLTGWPRRLIHTWEKK